MSKQAFTVNRLLPLPLKLSLSHLLFPILLRSHWNEIKESIITYNSRMNFSRITAHQISFLIPVNYSYYLSFLFLSLWLFYDFLFPFLRYSFIYQTSFHEGTMRSSFLEGKFHFIVLFSRRSFPLIPSLLIFQPLHYPSSRDNRDPEPCTRIPRIALYFLRARSHCLYPMSAAFSLASNWFRYCWPHR